MLREELAAVLQRILTGRMGELVDETLQDEAVLRIAHRTPETDRDPGAVQDIIDEHVRYGVGKHITRPAHRGRIQVVFEQMRERLEVPKDRLAHDVVLPGERIPSSPSAAVRTL